MVLKYGCEASDQRRRTANLDYSYFMNCELWEQSLCFIVAHARMDDNIVTLIPVDRSGDTVLVAQLKRVDNANNFVKVSSGRCGI